MSSDKLVVLLYKENGKVMIWPRPITAIDAVGLAAALDNPVMIVVNACREDSWELSVVDL